MGRTLLQKFTGTEVNENSDIVTSGDEHTSLDELMQDMKAQLDQAVSDVLCPRQEVLDKILNKVLH